jgi:DNA topoisomerase-1
MSSPTVLPTIEAAADAGLVYVTDALPGIRRVRRGDSFHYLNPNGSPIIVASTLERIRSLAIPPAYERVWICTKANGHLQATGFDARGRKQYRYHAKFREVREEAKFTKLLDFAAVLPKIRSKVDEDLSKPGMPREKVLAAVVYLLEKSLIRVGNEEYAKANGHYGLTTMLNRHAKVEGAKIKFRFKGKSGISHEIEIHDRRLARIVAKTQELPGQQLFNYIDDSGDWRDIASTDVNAYLKEIAGGEFTAKDFRTWAATTMALAELATRDVPATQRGGKIAVSEVMKSVARVLGNTAAVCRKCYVHPAVALAYLQGQLPALVAKCKDKENADELAVVQLLSNPPKMETPAKRSRAA